VVAGSPESLIANEFMPFHLFQGIETDHITFCIFTQHNKSKLSYRKFWTYDNTACVRCTRLLQSAIFY